MPEIPARDQTPPRRAHDIRDEVPGERPGFKGIRTVVVTDQHESCGRQRTCRGEKRYGRDPSVRKGRDEIWAGFSDRKRADDGPDSESPTRAKPGRGHLHGGWIDPREASAGEKA
jgi:hypothetical protein